MDTTFGQTTTIDNNHTRTDEEWGILPRKCKLEEMAQPSFVHLSPRDRYCIGSCAKLLVKIMAENVHEPRGHHVIRQATSIGHNGQIQVKGTRQSIQKRRLCQ
jgi:hypothetical protein